MKRSLFCVAFVLLLCPAVAFAQNPCAAAATPVVTQPGKALFVRVTAPEFQTKDIGGAFIYSSFEAAFFKSSDPNTPLGTPTAMQRSAFTLEPGTADCYSFTSPNVPAGLQGQGPFNVGLRAKNDAANIFSAWTLSANPFDFALTALPSLGRILIVR